MIDEKSMAALLAMDSFLQWQVELSPDDAAAFLAKAQDYNNFTATGLVRMIRSISLCIPAKQYGPNNPNTGKMHHHFAIGNECSRVVYVVIDKPYMPGTFDYQALASTIERAAKKAGADEYTIAQDDYWWKYRIWFD